MNPESAQEIRLKRLYFRSQHRGNKEMDIVLGKFAEAHLRTLEPGLLDIYERLLEEDDVYLWDWLVGKTAPPEEYAPLFAMMHFAA